MALFPGAATSGLAAAFRRFRDSGVPREALEQALSEAYQDQGQAQRPYLSAGTRRLRSSRLS